ncbi:hypothetical protein Sango_3028700 [Sesamum angolense]|uniref:Integrase catalytic domain-containing protein n=1 Tax=Sesamum angolense TaxID=2727404 RepID=A0AAE1VWR9_9LAMI|nr:hypothetical protein Sango_3028700 [Sesamum angolense]
MGKEKRRMGTQQQSRANDMCTYYREKGHWKRDCPNLSSNQGMFVVEVNMVTHSASWVLDTGCGAHIYNLENAQIWHARLRHISQDRMKRLVDSKSIKIDNLDNVPASITFIDDHSQYGYIYLMRYKSEAFVRFKEFRLEVENQTSCKIKILRSDRGGQYLSSEFIDYLKKNGIVTQWTPLGMPQLNGVDERRNRTLLDMIRSMMSLTELPLSF